MWVIRGNLEKAMAKRWDNTKLSCRRDTSDIIRTVNGNPGETVATSERSCKTWS
ncbi:hypothetical protein DPMN_047837 [Dreissena polymorpha]|uniref:Uncharacterized protein n=1 Tax=Dreissena polymorpha TaxID=45954 RepID=A0A9D4D8S3_DREPO|nr:hypothetical protein DPMN_047837 [Dreissena polymorpha]